MVLLENLLQVEVMLDFYIFAIHFLLKFVLLVGVCVFYS